MDVLARNRALGALAGVALGDAMGMPTQTLTRTQIAELYGSIADFRDAAPEQPVSAGLKAGTITDDMEQTLLLARHLVDRNGGFDEVAWAQTLLDWERSTRDRGINDLLGPSTKRAIDLLMQGVPCGETGRFGTTNGAAMRIVPVGVATPLEPLSAFVDRVEETCRLTHNTPEAIGAASAVAAMVSAGMDGAGFEDALPVALAAAHEGGRRGVTPGSDTAAACIERALALASGKTGDAAAAKIAEEVGTSVAALESVPMAFAIVRIAAGDPWKAALMSAAIGDDTDTIGAISCGMAGACAGLDAIPADMWQRVKAVNALELEPLVTRLLDIRESRQQSRDCRAVAS